MKRTIALVLAMLYGIVTTVLLVQAPVKCDKRILAIERDRAENQLQATEQDVRAAADEQQQVQADGERLRVEVREVFVPIKGKVRDVQVLSDCPGTYDKRVRDAVISAIDAANAGLGRVPAPQHRRDSPAPDGELPPVD